MSRPRDAGTATTVAAASYPTGCMTNHRTRSATEGSVDERKAKRSYTISFESVAFLEAVRKERKKASASAALEDILRAVRLQRQRAEVAAAVTEFYDSMSAEEAAEESSWANFAMREFAGSDVE